MKRTLDAVVGKEPFDEGVTGRLEAPSVGIFRATVRTGDAVEPGRELGRLSVVGRSVVVAAPAGARGQVLSVADRGAVQYGQPLVTLGAATAAEAEAAAGGQAASADGYAVKAPIDGIFYARPSPDADPYVTVGASVSAGQTVGLIEVMKTFNPVSLGGAGAPSSGTVLAMLASDGDEVAAGDVLLRISEG